MPTSERSRSVTMEDVAARAGVSRALVSIVFRNAPGASEATRARVMRAAEELSYRPDQRARLLGSKRSRTIGVVFGLRHEFHGELVEQLYRAAEGSGYELALGAVAPSRTEQRAVAGLVDYRVEALVLLGSTLRAAEIERLAADVPVVVVARALRRPPVDVVRTDDGAGARRAVEHLVGLGHRRIVHVDGHDAPGAAQRRSGYRAAMKAAGPEPLLLRGGLTEADGEPAAAELLRLDPAATAVTAFNDHCAAGLIAGLRSAGVRVPEDLSVVGFDDSHVAGLGTIALTTVAQDGAALARLALERAAALADGTAGEPRETVVPPHLVVRRTAAAPPA